MFRRFPASGRRRSRTNPLWPFLSRLFYLDPQKQYILIILSAVAMATLVFSGLLVFRQSDHGDMMTRGEWLMKQGKVALAAHEFEQVVRRYRNSYEAHLALGKAYMEIDEPTKAAKEFKVASLLKVGNPRESGAHIAISRLMIAEGKYEDAERELIKAYRARPQNRKDPELLAAMVDLYEDWGDWYLELATPNYEEAFLKYSTGLRFVKTEKVQAGLRDKLVSSSKMLADMYDNDKDYDKAIAVMKRALHYQYTADNMAAIAAYYEEKADVDSAIIWSRKAYELDPKRTSLNLSQLLIKKGRELNDAHLPKQAEAFFAEAQQVNNTVKTPLNELYPLKASQVKLSYNFNKGAVALTPTVQFRVDNVGNYPLAFLRVKVTFMSGSNKLSEVEKLVASNGDPLAPYGEPKGYRDVKLDSTVVIPLEDLEAGKLQVQILSRYSDGASARWYDLKNAEITVEEAQQITP